MKLHWSDWNRACISAAVLLALAGLAVFKIPHGFEEGVGWYVCLLPGAIFAAAISDLIQKVIPQSKSTVFDTLLIWFNFLWYFVISYLPLKTYRFVSATLKALDKWTGSRTSHFWADSSLSGKRVNQDLVHSLRAMGVEYWQ